MTTWEEIELFCHICGRNILKPRHRTGHHVFPKSTKPNVSKKINLCRCCHSDLHYVFSNEQLANMPFEEQRKALLKKIFPKENEKNETE